MSASMQMAILISSIIFAVYYGQEDGPCSQPTWIWILGFAFTTSVTFGKLFIFSLP